MDGELAGEIPGSFRGGFGLGELFGVVGTPGFGPEGAALVESYYEEDGGVEDADCGDVDFVEPPGGDDEF